MMETAAPRVEFIVGCVAGIADCIMWHWVDTLKARKGPFVHRITDLNIDTDR